jgi:hypothetical protein
MTTPDCQPKREGGVSCNAVLGHGTKSIMKTKKVKELEVGDKITLNSGEVRTVTEITNGVYRNSKLITWRDGWSCQPNEIELVVA